MSNHVTPEWLTEEQISEIEELRRTDGQTTGDDAYLCALYDNAVTLLAMAREELRSEREIDNWKDRATINGKVGMGFQDRAERLEIENAKLREALNSIVAASHSWVIRQETAELEIPIHQRYRKIATEALASKKDSKE